MYLESSFFVTDEKNCTNEGAKNLWRIPSQPFNHQAFMFTPPHKSFSPGSTAGSVVRLHLAVQAEFSFYSLYFKMWTKNQILLY